MEMNQDILGRKDLIRLGYNLLRYRNYDHEQAEELALDALYMCARKYRADRGTSIQTYYNKCLHWTCGHKMAKIIRHRRGLKDRTSIDDVGGMLESATATPQSIRNSIEIDDLLSLLPEREERIMRMIYIEGCTMSDIAKAEGVSRQRIGQITRGARNLLRLRIESESSAIKARE